MSFGPAGYQTKVLINGPSTVAAGEACVAMADDLAGRKRYQITNAAHRILDRTQAVTVYENGVAQAPAVLYRIDTLFGIIIFAVGHTPSTPVTADVHWLSTLPLPGGFDAKLSRKNMMGDNKQYADGDRQKRRLPTLLDASIALKGRGTVLDDYDAGTVGTQNVDGLVNAGTPMLVQLDPDGANTWVFRGWFALDSDGQNVPLADIASYDLSGQLDASGLSSLYGAGFAWGAP